MSRGLAMQPLVDSIFDSIFFPARGLVLLLAHFYRNTSTRTLNRKVNKRFTSGERGAHLRKCISIVQANIFPYT